MLFIIKTITLTNFLNSIFLIVILSITIIIIFIVFLSIYLVLLEKSNFYLHFSTIYLDYHKFLKYFYLFTIYLVNDVAAVHLNKYCYLHRYCNKTIIKFIIILFFTLLLVAIITINAELPLFIIAFILEECFVNIIKNLMLVHLLFYENYSKRMLF